ncbi:MAG: hypothetical protein K6G51_07845 [Sphaerochaetaceae bacterium]|nr:hypothetical protein [Sphaerochaetaceae bacterium]
MSKINLLCASNYPLSQKKCWKEGVAFYEKGEEEYPFDFEDSPYVVSSIGKPFDTELCIIANFSEQSHQLYASYRLGLECALNHIPYKMNFFRSGCASALLEGTKDGDGKVLVLLPGGMEYYLEDRKIFSPVVLGDGAIVSPFCTDEKVSGKNLIYNRYLMLNTSFTIFVNMGGGEYGHATRLLDNGKAVFLHRSSLKDKLARELALEGAPVIDSINQIIPSPLGYLYEEPSGHYVYDKTHSLSFLKVK